MYFIRSSKKKVILSCLVSFVLVLLLAACFGLVILILVLVLSVSKLTLY